MDATSLFSRETAQKHRTRTLWRTLLQAGNPRDAEPAPIRYRGDIHRVHRPFAGRELQAAPSIAATTNSFDWRRRGQSIPLRRHCPPVRHRAAGHPDHYQRKPRLARANHRVRGICAAGMAEDGGEARQLARNYRRRPSGLAGPDKFALRWPARSSVVQLGRQKRAAKTFRVIRRYYKRNKLGSSTFSRVLAFSGVTSRTNASGPGCMA